MLCACLPAYNSVIKVNPDSPNPVEADARSASSADLLKRVVKPGEIEPGDYTIDETFNR